MTKDTKDKKITIDHVEYKIDDLSENARRQIMNIQFVDTQLQQLNNEWAVSDTAGSVAPNALRSTSKNDSD